MNHPILAHAGLTALAWADLRSWRTADGTDRIFLSQKERTEHWPGQAIGVGVRAGALRLPWIVSLAVDEEEYNRQILAIAPNARAVRIDWYLRHHRWPEATLDYLDRFPSDDAIRTFEQMLERRPNYPEVKRQLTWLREKVGQPGALAR